MIVFSAREALNLSVPVAQLDRVSVSEAEGLEFESQRARIFLLSIYIRQAAFQAAIIFFLDFRVSRTSVQRIFSLA